MRTIKTCESTYFHSFLTITQHGRSEIYVPGDVLPWKQLPVPVVWDDGSIPGPVRTNWRRYETAGNEQLLVGSPASSPAQRTAALSRLFTGGFSTAIFN
jgi:hypothetical protein